MKLVLNKDKMQIEKEQDVVPFRNRVKEYAVKLGMSLVNQTKLITAASELVRNMLKYAGGGLAIIEVISMGRDSGIRLTFQDNGPGIDPAYHNRIFEMFQTLKPRDLVEGSGIGLAVVKRSVESRGGTIGVESKSEDGATFRFTWPKSTSTRVED